MSRPPGPARLCSPEPFVAAEPADSARRNMVRENTTTDAVPPSREAVEAAIQLLRGVPRAWGDVPELSHLEGQGLGLLVAGGLVERRLSLRLRAVGDTRVVAVRFRFTGQAGLAQATEPALAEGWALWEAAWKAGQEVYVEPSEGEGEWRLTEQGELAEKGSRGDRDDVRYLRDHLRTPGVAGVEPGGPLSFVPGVWRPIVKGEGHVERVEVVNADSEPLSVRVENLGQLCGQLGGIERAIQEGLQRLAAGSGQSAERHAVPESTGAEQAKTAGQGLDGIGGRSPRLWTQRHCPSCGRPDVEFISQTEFAKRTGENRQTVSDRIRTGKYLHDARRQVPWCAECKEKTPEGSGAEKQIDAPPASTFVSSQADLQCMLDWAQRWLPSVWPGCPKVDWALLNERRDWTRPEQRAYDLVQAGAQAVMALAQKRGAMPARDEAEVVALQAMRKELATDARSRLHESQSDKIQQMNSSYRSSRSGRRPKPKRDDDEDDEDDA